MMLFFTRAKTDILKCRILESERQEMTRQGLYVLGEAQAGSCIAESTRRILSIIQAVLQQSGTLKKAPQTVFRQQHCFRAVDNP